MSYDLFFSEVFLPATVWLVLFFGGGDSTLLCSFIRVQSAATSLLTSFPFFSTLVSHSVFKFLVFFKNCFSGGVLAPKLCWGHTFGIGAAISATRFPHPIFNNWAAGHHQAIWRTSVLTLMSSFYLKTVQVSHDIELVVVTNHFYSHFCSSLQKLCSLNFV